MAENRLEEFVQQEEARGVGSAMEADFDAVVRRIVRKPGLSDQTSGSAPNGGSAEK